MAQGDLGFFSSKRKQYGGFFLAVNTYSGFIFVTKISNTKTDTLVAAIGQMVKVTFFKKRGGVLKVKSRPMDCGSG